MKKVYQISVLVTALVLSFASCKKSDEKLLANDFEVLENNVPLAKEGIVTSDPFTVFLQHLDSLYGECYDIYNYYAAKTPQYKNILVIPNLYLSFSYLTVVYSSPTNIYGIYDLSYICSDEDDQRTWGYNFSVCNPEDSYNVLFETDVVCYNNMAPRLRVNINSLNFPDDYPYPLFDNIHGQYVGLENVSNLSFWTNNDHTEVMVALRAAATFYTNFCGS